MSKPDRAKICRTIEDLQQIVLCREGAPLTIALDTETTGLIPFLDKITWVSWAISEDCFGAFPIKHRNPITDPEVEPRAMALIRHIIKDPTNTIIWHNGSFDITMLVSNGWFSVDDLHVGRQYDTMLASYVLNPVRRNEGGNHSLKGLYRDILKRTHPEWENQPEFDEVRGDLDFRDVLEEQAYWYASFDAWSTLQLYHHFEGEFSTRLRETDYFHRIEMPHLLSTVELRLSGMNLLTQDQVETNPKLKTIIARKEEYERIKQIVFGLLGETFNFESPEAMRKALFFGRHGIRPLGRGRKSGKYILDKGTLADILCEQRNLNQRNCETIAYILYAKQIADSIKKHEEVYGHVNPVKKKVQPNIAPMTVSGRYWASQPNTLSLSSTSEIKQHIVPARGNCFVIGDFSQIDLRVIANETALENPESDMLKEVNKGVDLHLNTLKIVYPDRVGETWKRFYKKKTIGPDGKEKEELAGVEHKAGYVGQNPEPFNADRLEELEEIKKIRHNVAKPINFGVSYGLGPSKLMENLNSTDEFREQILAHPKTSHARNELEEATAKMLWTEELKTQLKRPNQTLEEVKGYLDRFHKTYPDIKRFQKKVEDELISQGYCYNIFGRYCPAELIPHMKDSPIDIKLPGDRWFRVWQERIGLNKRELQCRVKKITLLKVTEPRRKRVPSIEDLRFEETEVLYRVNEEKLQSLLVEFQQSGDNDQLIDDLLALHQESSWDVADLFDIVRPIPPCEISTGVELVDRPLCPFVSIPESMIRRVRVGPEQDRNFITYIGYDALRRKLISQRVASTSMDICKIAMIELRRRFASMWPDSRQRPCLINCIHDEIAVECQEDIAPRVKNLMEEIMQTLKKVNVFEGYLAHPGTMPVEIEAEVKIGKNYAEAKP